MTSAHRGKYLRPIRQLSANGIQFKVNSFPSGRLLWHELLATGMHQKMHVYLIQFVGQGVVARLYLGEFWGPIN